MREIKFRGKRVDNGEWVYGDLIHRYSNWIYIAPIPSTIEITPIEIDPETVGQYTGLKDKKGKEIYEGDIVRQRRFLGWDKQNGERYKDIYGVVRFENGMFTCGIVDYTLIDWNKCEVIGNKWENPELLKEVKE